MKKNIHEKIYVWTLAFLILFICYNGSVLNPSSNTTPAPDINFYGTLEDHIRSSKVESILIGKQYESIPVYSPSKIKDHHENKNVKEQIDPKQNKTFINLQDITSIELKHPHNPTDSSIQINNKIYIQIVIEFLHGTKKSYLVESSRKISCKEINKGTDIKDTPILQDREISFIHIKKLTIKGYKSNSPYQSSQIDAGLKEEKSIQKSQVLTNKEKEEFKTNSAELFHAIEENVKNLPLDNPSAFETMRSTILTLLKSLRDQLQKFLDMIK